MVNTTLRGYVEELKLLLEQEALEEVMGHCRHILQYFPKNVETYRLLGRALLDKNRHQEAGDVFQRVLSALPNDFIAHLGMSSISEEQGQLPAAIWYLERAYEQEPNNAALQDEIKRLTEKRDGIAPDRVQLTRGGLAHLYAKGRLYDQAINELKSALEQMPERTDLRLLLAQVYWESDHAVEAAEMALQVLEKLPDSIEANHIIASLWLKAGRPSDAAPFAKRLEQLDPFAAWETLNPDGKPLPNNALQLPRLDWDARAAASIVSDVPDWVGAISNVFSAPDSVSLSGNVTSWLEDAVPGPQSKPPTAPLTSPKTGKSGLLQSKLASMSQSPAPADQTADEVPDWARAIMNPGDAAPANTSTSNDDMPDWFKDTSAETANAAGSSNSSVNLPDWFADEPDAATPAQNSAEVDWFSDAGGSTQPASTAPAAASWLDDDELPSGFTDLLAANAARVTGQSGSSEPATPSAGLMPDWLSDESDQPAAAIDPMAWLVTGPLTMPGGSADSSPVHEQSDAETNSDSEANSGSDFSFDALFGDNADTSDMNKSQSVDSALDWMQSDTMSSAPSMDSFSTPSSDSDADFGSRLDWLTTDSAQTSQPDLSSTGGETSEPGDALDWLSEESNQPASTSQPDSSASSGFDWMSSSFDAGFDKVSESDTTSDSDADADPLAWMRSYNASDSGFGEASTDDTALSFEDDDNEADLDAVQPGETPSWLSNMAPSLSSAASPDAASLDALDFSNLNTPTETEPAPDALDWLSGSDSTISTADNEADLDAVQPGDAPSWLSDMAAPLSSAASPEAGSLDSLDFSDLNTTPEPASDALDWLSGSDFTTTAADNEADLDAVQPGEAPSWLSDMAAPLSSTSSPEAGSLDSLDFSDLNTPTESESVADDLDWLSGSDSTINTATTAADSEADLDAVQPGDAPSWLYDMAPSLSSASSPDAASLDSLDFSNFNTTPEPAPAALDWLSGNDSPPAADDEGDADEWLAKFAADQPVAASPASGSPAPASSSLELEDDWLNSFEQPADEKLPVQDWLTPASSTSIDSGSESADNWLSSFNTPSPAASTETGAADDDGDDWLNSFDASASEPAPLGENTADELNTPDWLSSSPPPIPEIQESETADPVPNWLDSVSIDQPSGSTADSMSPSDDAGADQDMPEWMRGMAPIADLPGSEDQGASEQPKAQFSELLKGAATRAEQSHMETGILDPNAAPDWLFAVTADEDESPTTEAVASALSMDDLDFGSFDPDAVEPDEIAPAAAPDWLSNMAPEFASDSGLSLGDLDFGSLDKSAEQAQSPSEAPDWLSNIAPASGSATPSATNAAPEVMDNEPDWLSGITTPQSEPQSEQGTTQPSWQTASSARHDMPDHFPEVDFGSIADSADTNAATAADFNGDTVARPANLVNTNAQSSTESFKFNRTPAWLRKKGNQTNASKSSADDLPDWLSSPGSGDND